MFETFERLTTGMTLDLLGSLAELMADMVDIEVYKCSENVDWPSFTLSNVYSTIGERVRGRSDSKKCAIACIRPH